MNLFSDNALAKLREGNLREANHLLGSPYHLKGTVIKGNQIGRTIGFPTANIHPSEETPLYLPKGVYAVYVDVKGHSYHGMSNIGVRPTLNLHQLSIEVNIFDFEDDIYGETISVLFMERVRDEIKFPGLEALKEQIEKDKVSAEKLLEMRLNPDSCT
jgi:riboflavin kinase/FMN adenylyltransferase